MPLEAPVLDSRRFEEIFEQARLRIPRYTPEWRDWNESDPGITLLQLFAWLTEMQLYELNRVPDRSYIKFLQLLGLELRPAQPAQADLTFTPRANAPVQGVPGADARCRRAAGRRAAAHLRDREGAESRAAPAHGRPGVRQRRVHGRHGGQRRAGDDLPAARMGAAGGQRALPRASRRRTRPPPSRSSRTSGGCGCSSRPLRGPASRRTQPRPSSPRRRPCGSSGSTCPRRTPPRGGSSAPSRTRPRRSRGMATWCSRARLAVAPLTLGAVEEERYWVRGRLEAGTYPGGAEPEIDTVRPNTVPAQNLATVHDEPLGVSEGHPDRGLPAAQDAGQGRHARPARARARCGRGRALDDGWTTCSARARRTRTTRSTRIRARSRTGNGRHGQIPPAGRRALRRGVPLRRRTRRERRGGRHQRTARRPARRRGRCERARCGRRKRRAGRRGPEGAGAQRPAPSQPRRHPGRLQRAGAARRRRGEGDRDRARAPRPSGCRGAGRGDGRGGAGQRRLPAGALARADPARLPVPEPPPPGDHGAVRQAPRLPVDQRSRARRHGALRGVRLGGARGGRGNRRRAPSARPATSGRTSSRPASTASCSGSRACRRCRR